MASKKGSGGTAESATESLLSGGEVPAAPGLKSPVVREQGEREPGEDKLLLPRKFKISNKALVSSSEHGVIFVSC